MPYRIEFFRDDRKTGDVPCNKPLLHARAYAADLMSHFRADHAWIIDDTGVPIERLNRRAQ